jgi:hypothetical protein
MTPELAAVVVHKGIARGLMMGQTRLEADWHVALGHISSEGWRRSAAETKRRLMVAKPV